jgi:amino acid adenylation domain-containing protein
MENSVSQTSLICGFIESAERFPARPALVVDGESLSYGDLRTLAGKIATAIRGYEQTSFRLAALLAHRSRTAYAGVLGVLGAGKGYVPINCKFPIRRSRRMLALSGCNVLVVGKECLAQLQHLLPELEQALTVILPDVADVDGLAAEHPRHHFVSSEQVEKAEVASMRPEVSSDATAYLLFTSGSTGEPKGVPISQSNVRSYIEYVCERYKVNEHDRFSQEFDQTFDLSVHDMFVCWERGACLCCVPDKSVMAPAKFIRDNRLTMWFSVPSVVGLLAKMRLLSRGCFPSLRFSLFCGEPLSVDYARQWQDAAPNSIVENLYGPTEATIAITHYRWDQTRSTKECLNGIVPIGWIFPRQQFRIVDEQGKAVPLGEQGELCLSGSQVSNGYWNDPQKTEQQFVRLPAEGDAVWYRTGDVIKQDSRGCLYYLGRIDQQVKIRGYRVELQEIEAVLRKACGAEQVVSIAWPVENGSADGVAAFVSGVQTLDQDHVIASCSHTLPDYMVPKKIYLLDEMPLNPNGKIDRRKLANLLGG